MDVIAEIAQAWVSILPSAKGFSSKLNSEVSSGVTGVGKKLGSGFGKVFAAAAAIGIGAKVFDFFGDALDEAREAQVVGARTESVIKSMGAASWISAEQVGALASALSKKVGIDDEAIQSGQNLLLTFGKIRNEVGAGNDIFDRASTLMVDMSAAMGTDMKGSAVQLGKALNDPIKGVTALTRVGVSFTEAQKEQIKALVESGDTLKAQKLILGEVEKQFGGAAKSMATPAMKAAVAWGNFKETVGTLLLPVIDRLLRTLTPLIVQLGDKLPGAVKAVSAAIAPVVSAISGALQPALDWVGSWMRDNPEFVKAFAISLGVLVGAITAVTIATSLFSLALQTTGIPIVIIALAALVAGLIVAYQKSEQFRSIVQQIGVVLQQVGLALVEFGNWIRTNVVPVIVDLAQKVASNLKPVFEQLAQTFQNSILPAVQQLIEKFREWQPTIQRVAEVVIGLVAKWIDFYTTVAGKVLPVVIRFVGWVVSNVIPAFIRWVEMIAKIIGRLVEFGAAVGRAGQDVVAFARTVATQIGNVVAYFKAMPARIKEAVGNLKDLLFQKGKDLLQGFLNGINAVWDAVVGRLQALLDKVQSIANAIQSAINRATPGLGQLGPAGDYLPDTNNPVGGTHREIAPSPDLSGVGPQFSGRSTFGGGDAAQVDHRLARIEAAILTVAPDLGRQLNGSVADGHRRRRAA